MKKSDKKKELVAVQGRPKDGSTIGEGLGGIDMGIEEVDIIKLGGVLDQ